MILEDDFVPFNFNDTIFKVSKFLNEVQNWHLIQLASHPDSKTHNINIDNVQKVIESQGALAYGVSKDFINVLLNLYYESSNELSKEEKYKEPCLYCIDVNWKKLQKESNWFTFYPSLGKEFPKFSDVQNRFLSHYII